MEIYGERQKVRRDEAEAKLGRSLTEEEEALVKQSAVSYLENPIQIEAAKVWTLHRVNLIWHRNIIAMSGPQVLRQGVVLLWGAFEVLSTDLFVAAADAKRDLLRRIVGSKDVQKDCTSKVTAPKWTEAKWPENRGKIKMNSMTSISTAYQALLPTAGPKLSPAPAWFADPQLNILEQKRHLIVHRAAIKDAEYLEKSRDVGSVGDELVVTPDDFRIYAETVIRIGTQMLQAIEAEL